MNSAPEDMHRTGWMKQQMQQKKWACSSDLWLCNISSWRFSKKWFQNGDDFNTYIYKDKANFQGREKENDTYVYTDSLKKAKKNI